MPNTRELVGIIKEDYAQDWGIPKILQFLDRAQRFLMKNDCAQTCYYNYDDPDLPFPILSTTAEQLSYEIPGDTTCLVDSEGNALTPSRGGYPLNIRRIRHVFIMVSDLATSSYDKKFYGKQFQLVGLNQYWSQRLYRVSFFKVPVHIEEASGLQSYPKVTFFEDPGTHDNKYLIEMFFDPIELTSASIPLSLDGDKWEEALIDGTVGYIEDVENGRSERLEKFRTYWKRKFLNEMNRHEDERREPKMKKRPCL